MTTQSQTDGIEGNSVAAQIPENVHHLPARFSDVQLAILAARGIDEGTARGAGVLPVQHEDELPAGCPEYWTVEAGYLPGLLFTYRSPTGHVELQLRPDVAVRSGRDGKVAKYVFAKGALSVLHEARPIGPDTHAVLITEGTCQTIMAARWAPAGVAVMGIAGCQSWMRAGVPSGDLKVVEGLPAVICLDADAESNRNVYDAGIGLQRATLPLGARVVRFVQVPGGRNTGLDDYLAPMEPGARTAALGYLISEALDRTGRNADLPARVKPAARGRAGRAAGAGAAGGGGADDESAPGWARWYGEDGSLLVEQLAQDIVDQDHCLLARDDSVAVYRDGAYVLDKLAVRGAITDRLGDTFSTGKAANVEAFLVAELARLGLRLPEYVDAPVVNFRNGMLDLRTGELLPHGPQWGSQHQMAVDWAPEALCPTFDVWLSQMAGRQVQALLEAVSALLDPSVAPSRALFLFGPPRSGKSTFLELIEALVGRAFVAGVSLHQLADDVFAAADLYGKVLNVDADVKAADVQDLSLFKRLTGHDVIQANKKYGGRFTFRNRALFAFSANELPAVGENSRAYVARVTPVLFGRSVEGAEDPSYGARLRAELPGIAVRLVRAWQAVQQRGGALGADRRVVELFERASDRVAQWINDRAEVLPVGEFGMTATELHAGFRAWARDTGVADLGRKSFTGRLAGIEGAAETRDRAGDKRGWNVRIRPSNSWTDGNVQDLYAEVMEVLEGPAVAVTPPATPAVPAVSEPTVSQSGGASQFSHIETRRHSQLLRLQSDTVGYSASNCEAQPNTATVGSETAGTAGVAGGVTTSGTSVTSKIVTGIRAVAPPWPAPCPVCGSPLVLVDGVWWSCPRCHPATARVEEAP